MTREVQLSCRCGAVRGVVTGVAPSTINRSVCYCNDCQAAAHQLHRADLLDAHGGSQIVQLAPATMRIVSGHEQIRGLRLTDKGLHRFYASCCNTPVGNTMGLALPFVGVALQAFVLGAPGSATDADSVFGPSRGASFGHHAIGTPPEGTAKFDPRLIGRLLWCLMKWALKGQRAPNPFFDSTTKKPSFQVDVLSMGERDALRPLCGPRAA
jgi:hypothetical protein